MTAMPAYRAETLAGPTAMPLFGRALQGTAKEAEWEAPPESDAPQARGTGAVWIWERHTTAARTVEALEKRQTATTGSSVTSKASPFERAAEPTASGEAPGRGSLATMAQQILRTHYANQLLAELAQLQEHCAEPIAARYAGSLLRTMRTVRDVAPFDPFVDVVVALHNALAFENRWTDYSAEQYQEAYEILRKLGQRRSVSDDKAAKAIMELEEMGFDTTPFTLEPASDED
jgi:hypothetical protein